MDCGNGFWTGCNQLADANGKLNWDIHFVDGSVVRAHLHAAGALMGEVDPDSGLSARTRKCKREKPWDASIAWLQY